MVLDRLAAIRPSDAAESSSASRAALCAPQLADHS
jgi:hypothetical protein